MPSGDRGSLGPASRAGINDNGNNPDETKGKDGAGSQADNAVESPISTPITPKYEPPKTDSAAIDAENNKNQPNDNLDTKLVKWTRVVAIFTGLLFVAAALQFGAAMFQWSAMQGQLAEMRGSSEQTERAIGETARLADNAAAANAAAVEARNTAKKSADDAIAVAKAANKTTADAARQQLRAYISTMPPSDITRIGDVNTWYWNIMLQWKNTGLTPTRNARGYFACSLTDDDIRKPLNIKAMTLDRRVIAAGETVVAARCTIAPDVLARAEAHGKRNYVSIIYYDDIFGHSHVSEQCVRFDWQGDYTRFDTAFNIIHSLCPADITYNCEDNDCRIK
jgi:hypothetical protein